MPSYAQWPSTVVNVLGQTLMTLTQDPPAPGPMRRMLKRWFTTTVWLLRYEPSWFAEFGLGLGAALWGLGALLTDDIVVRSWGYALPVLAIAGGVIRCFALLKLWYEARVLFAGLGAALWAWLWIGLTARYGLLPLPGLLVGVFVTEMLTAAKFSIPCAQDIRDEYIARKRGRE